MPELKPGEIMVVPREGFKIVDPVLRDNLPPEGRVVADSIYWQRRIGDKDVTMVDPAKSAKK